MAEPGIFDAFDPDASPDATQAFSPAAVPNKSTYGTPNIFDQFDEELKPEAQTSTGGALARGAAESVLPSAGGLAGAAAGAEIGAVAGLPGIIVGGLAGAFGGSWLTGKAQDAAMTALPEDWQESIDNQRRIDQTYHPTASFLGGLLPYVLTMRPGGFARAALPENATALTRIMSHPATAHLFGGAVMGGMELGQEAVAGQKPDWTNVGIATGLGLVFNRPNRIGETIMGAGERPVRALLGREAPAMPPPSIAQAGDARVMGPGITEDVFQGSHEQAPEAAMAAQDAARTEQSIIEPRPAPDLFAIARRLDPDTMDRYDELSAQRDSFRARIDQLANPSDEDIAAATDRRDGLQTQLDEHVAGRGGYTAGPQARQLRAQIREAQAEIDDLNGRRAAYAEGRGEDTPEMAALREQMMQADFAMRDLAPARAAALRRAADATNAHTVAPEGTPEGVTVDRTKDIPYGGGSSVDGSKVYIDKDIPTSLDVKLKDGDGTKPMDPAQFIVIHEVKEHHEMVVNGRPYEPAHRLALKDEQAAVEGAGYDFADYQRQVMKAVDAIEHKGTDPTIKPPADLYTKPYPHKEAEFIKHEADKTAPTPAAPVAAGQPAPAAPIDIVDDVTGQLVRAGRPEDEAQAAGQLIAARYRARAGWFQGRRGAAEDLYRDEGAEILGPGVRRAARASEPVPGMADLELAQRQQASIKLAAGIRPLIRLAATADASSFIHESGHDFLEQLMRDAAHELAPDQLKTDAQTALKWLGAQSAEDIKTRQHEKFARGFEQYMREGVAPSPGLASVFAKFKNWLTAIYATIKGLGKPISEDIRAVFDRMLSTEPQRTVVAEGAPGGPSLADIHEADAKLTEPQEARAALSRVREEMARTEEEIPANARAEIERATGGPSAAAGEPGGGGGVSPTGAGPLPTVGGAAGPVAADRPVGERPGKVGAGSGAPRAEGAPASGGAGTGAGGRAGPVRAEPSSPLAGFAPKPADTIGRPEPRFVDKAGNIRLDNLDTPEDVNQAIREISAGNDDFIGDRRGVVSPGQVLDLAKAIGKEGSEELVDSWVRGRAYNAEQVTALRMLFTESSKAAAAAMQRASAGTPEDIAAYAQARQRLVMIQRTVAGATAEAGRALAAFRSLKGLQAAFDDQMAMQATGRTLFQLRMEARMGTRYDTPEKIATFMQNAQERSFGRMIVEFWTNNLIAGIATHVTYTVGNKILALMRHGPETLAAAAVGHIAQGLGREGAVVPWGEAPARLAAYFRAYPAASQAALEGLRSGMTTRLPGEEARPLIPFTSDTAMTIARTIGLDPVTWREVGGDLYGFVTGIRDSIVATAELVAAGGEAGAPALGLSYSPLGYNPDIAIRGVPVIPVGSLMRIPGRFIAALHSFDRVASFRANLTAEAFRTATDEAAARAGTAAPMSPSEFYERVGYWQQNPTQEMLERSHLVSTEIALMGKGGPLLQAFARLSNTAVKLPFIGELPILKFVDPFVKIAGNVMNQAILQRTPVGILAPSIREDILGRHGTIAQDTAIGRMAVGTAMALTFGTLAAEGYMSGSGPSDPHQSAIWRLAGNQAHSVRVGDMWYQVNRLGPMGMLGSIAADLYDVAHAASQGDMMQAAATLHHAFVQNILDESFMRGPADLIKAVEDPGRYGEAYIRNFLSSFVPFSVGLAQMDRATDPYARDARTVMDAVKAKIPGLSETVLPRRDIWGEALPNVQGIVPGVTSIFVQRMSRDPVNLAMLRVGVFPGTLDRTIRNVQLTPEQYDDFQRIAGRMAKQRLDVIVRSPDFQTWAPHVQHDVMTEVIRQSRETARGVMMMKFPSIVRDATAAKLAKVRGVPAQ